MKNKKFKREFIQICQTQSPNYNYITRDVCLPSCPCKAGTVAAIRRINWSPNTSQDELLWKGKERASFSVRSCY